MNPCTAALKPGGKKCTAGKIAGENTPRRAKVFVKSIVVL